jgi:hypothetical protein
MVEEACQCQEGFGLAHSHLTNWREMELGPPRLRPDGRPAVQTLRPTDTGWVRLWIDWRSVARALCVGTTSMSGETGNVTAGSTSSETEEPILIPVRFVRQPSAGSADA